MTTTSAGSPAGATPSSVGTVLVGTFNEPGSAEPLLPASGGLIATTGWPEDPEVLAGTGPDAASWLVRGRPGTPSAGWLYAALHLEEGAVAVLSPAEDHQRSPQHDVGWVASQRIAAGGSFTCHADLNPAGDWLAAASYGSGTLTIASVLEDGLLGDPVAVQAPSGSGPVPSRQEAPHLHFVLFLDDDRLLVTDLGADRMLEYSIAALRAAAADKRGDSGAVDADGALAAAVHVEPVAVHPLPAGTGPRHLAVLPPLPDAGIDAQHLAVVGELDSRLHILDLGEELQEVAIVPTHAPDADPETTQDNQPSHLVLSADHHLIYVANRGRNTIGVIRRAGPPELIAEVPCGGNWPRHIALAEFGENGTLLVALERGDAVVGLPLDRDGIPGRPAGRVTLRRPGFLLPSA
ncbi:lactonase family protein [Citricoccus sp. GCM10030269]|uniref:lactonase family protein n=1 Tax=Citricoccus sp. GCM10030269 TaxID=3273388 RepID=UPI00360F45FE